MFINKTCLLCLENNHDNLLEIYGKQGIDLNVGTILQQHFWFEAGTFAAHKICGNCWKKVESFHSFYNFVKCIHQQTFETKAIIDNGLFCSIKEEPIDIKEVFDILNDIPDTTDSPAPIYDELEVDSGTTKGPAKVKHKTRKYTRKTSASLPADTYHTDAHSSLLSQYFNMACDLCDTLLPSFRETKKHYRQIHKKDGYLICCNKKYFRLQCMLSHCEWHMNPFAFKCGQCPLTFRDKYRLAQHSKEFHAPETERVFNCNDCDERFSRQNFLNAHQKKRHAQSFECPICQKCFTGKISLRYHIQDNHSPEDEREFRRNMKCLTKVDQVKEEDKPFVCDICGSRFVLHSNIRSHINRVHVHRNFDRKIHRDVHSHICEICAKPFKTRGEREKHYLYTHTNKVEKLSCDLCGKWFKHKHRLSSHMRWHKSRPATCTICGRVSSNQKALNLHVQRVHREASLECIICGKMFKDKKLLKEHEAIHAGITDLYTCTFCTKTFRSNANMYTHRKRAHPAEFEKFRKNNKMSMD